MSSKVVESWGSDLNRLHETHNNNLAMMANLNTTAAATSDSEIANFYDGRSIFITGATGFMGKVLVEKLLRSCPGINKIYILMRPKKGMDPKQRLDALFKYELFRKFQENGSRALSKVVVVAGDISHPGLGISDDDVQTLMDEVSIVFHSAATVKFDEPLRMSVEFNLLGTRRVIQLCHKLKYLKAFIHVSTAYANCNLTEVDEVFYPPPHKPQQIIDMVEWMDDDLVEKITPTLLGDRPNTYTYTKALAEALLLEECGDLPAAVIRPSIVTAAWREPLSGWIDNLNGPTGLVLAVGKGVMRTMLYDCTAVADIIPVDVVINLMITAAWATGTRPTRDLMIYNCTSGDINCITWGDIEDIAFPVLIRNPSSEVFRYPGGSFKQSRLMNEICAFIDHTIPAYVFDAFCGLTGKKRVMVRVVEKLHKAVGALEWFTCHQWEFKSKNLCKLHQELKGSDVETFNFDIRKLDWPTYWDEYVLGMRKFILKEDPSTLPQARKNLSKLYYINKLAGVGMLFGIYHLFNWRTQLAEKMWYFLTTLAMRLYGMANSIAPS